MRRAAIRSWVHGAVAIGLATVLASGSVFAGGPSADPLPPNLTGKKPTNFKELQDTLRPAGFAVGMPKLDEAGVRIDANLTYVTRGASRERPVRLDLYRPAGAAGPLPVVVLVHGGAWRKGDKEGERSRALWLAKHGYAAAAIEYRLSPEAKFPAALHDCQAAVAFVKRQARDYGLDRNRVAVFGGSAGAHLAALLVTTATEPSLRDPALPKNADLTTDAAIVVAGPTDTQSESAAKESRTPDNNYAVFLGGSIDEMPKLYETISPARWASSATPPVLVFDENTDAMSAVFRAKLKGSGVTNESFVLTGGLHGCWSWEPWFTYTMTRTDDFLGRVMPPK